MANIESVQKELARNLATNNRFGVLKFVDIGQGTGKLGDGVLQAEKLDKFLQAMTEATVFMDNIKMNTSDNDNAEVDAMGFELELEAGRLNGVPQTLSEYQDPNMFNRRFSAEELRALTGIHRTALRQNIEKKGFMNTLSQSFGSGCGRALERILIYADTDSTENNVSSGYKVIDGALKKLTDDGDNAVDEVDLTANDSNIVTELRRIIDAFPDKYIEDGKMKLFVPEIVKREFVRYIADNKDGDASISYVENKLQAQIEGIPLISVPAFSNPKNGYDKPIILTHEENLQFLINSEKVIVEDEFNLKANKWDIAATVYSDIQFVFPDATSLAFLKEA